ncbi:MAG: sulfite exporter TauE/SafE family protein [Gammaproteobacteria bacterium]|nr:sulfite exporter TauE/SafE family protein [Gammaproteobacteria bacterium]MDH5653931.1 sulfite exporter TauE/SafE family protein [Gammaproteobacteria bacterium]
MEVYLIYGVLGLFTGVVAGLLGVGGGLIIVPVLVMIFQQQGFNADIIVHLAVGTSLATIVFTSLSSVRAHHAHGAVLWPVFWRLTPGIVVGALLGAVAAELMSAAFLKRFFAVFELAVALQMWLGLRPDAARALPGRWAMSGAGGVIGLVSAIVGIGGGTLTVPFLVWCNVTMQKAVATSSATGLPIAVAGATGFMLTGWGESSLPAQSSGFVYQPAFFGIVVTSVLSAPLGAWLAHKLPAKVLKKVFAIFIAILGLRMLLG